MTTKTLFDRVWVTFRGNAPPKDDIDAAARLAAALRAELCGLHLEDDDLATMADLPFVNQITLTGGRLTWTRGDLARSFRALQRTVERMLHEATQEAGLSWSFDKRTGALQELLLGLQEREVLFLGPPAGPKISPWRPRKRQQPITVLTVYNGTPASRRALIMAHRLARHEGVDLVICLTAPDLDAEHDLQASVATHLEGATLPIHYHTLHKPYTPDLLHIQRTESSAWIVLGLDDSLPDPEQLNAKVPCSLVLVR